MADAVETPSRTRGLVVRVFTWMGALTVLLSVALLAGVAVLGGVLWSEGRLNEDTARRLKAALQGRDTAPPSDFGPEELRRMEEAARIQRESLDAREAELTQLEERVRRQAETVTTRLEQLEKERAALEEDRAAFEQEARDRQEALEAEGFKTSVRHYENMQPEEAAAQLYQLPVEEVTPIIAAFGPRHAAKVLTALAEIWQDDDDARDARGNVLKPNPAVAVEDRIRQGLTAPEPDGR